MKRFLPSLRRLFGPKLRCWPGATAQIVSSVCGNEGKIVRCIRLASDEEIDADWMRTDLGPVWVIDGTLRTTDGGHSNLSFDVRMRPITPRGDEVSDAEVKALFKSDTAPMVTKEAAA